MEYYEKLLEECSYLQVDYQRLHNMKQTLGKMQCNIKQLRINKLQAEIQQIKLKIKKANWLTFMKGV